MRRGVLAEIEIRGREFSRHCMEIFSLHEFYLLWAVVLLLVPLPVQVVVQGRVLKGLRSETRFESLIKLGCSTTLLASEVTLFQTGLI